MGRDIDEGDRRGGVGTAGRNGGVDAPGGREVGEVDHLRNVEELVFTVLGVPFESRFHRVVGVWGGKGVGVCRVGI